MTSYQIAKEHFAKTNEALIVQIRNKDYILYKMYFSGWEMAINEGKEITTIPLYILNPTRRERLGYRWISTKNISIKQEVQ